MWDISRDIVNTVGLARKNQAGSMCCGCNSLGFLLLECIFGYNYSRFHGAS